MSIFSAWGWLTQLWHIGLAAGLLALAGWLWFASPIPFARYGAVACIAVALFIFGRADGRRVAAADCQTGALRASLAAQEARTEEAQRQARAAEFIALQHNARAVAAEQETEAEKRKVEDYAAELAKRPANCALDDADLRRLQ